MARTGKSSKTKTVQKTASKIPRDDEDKKPHKKRDSTKFNIYIEKVLKEIHSDKGISGEAMVEMNNMIVFFIDKIMRAVNKLTEQSEKQTISSKEIQTAVRLCLPGELAKHAVSEGTKAIVKFNTKKSNQPRKKEGVKSQGVSRSVLAGLQFPVARVESAYMRVLSRSKRVGAGAPIYLTAVLEYLAAEILELAGNAATSDKKIRIKPRHITLAVLNDEELKELLRGSVLGGGVIPNIHSALLPRKKSKKQIEEDEEDEE